MWGSGKAYGASGRADKPQTSAALAAWRQNALGLGFGLVGAALSTYVLLLLDASAQRNRAVTGGAGFLSAWCALACVRELVSSRAPLSLQPRRVRARAALSLLLRALLCGLSVAMLGWSAAARSGHLPTAELLLMAAMQGSATACAWGACAMQRDARPRSPPPHDHADEDEDERDDDEEGTGSHYSTPPSSHRRKKRSSATLPRGWRYHVREGLFEHKRSGRLQREPPSTGVTGSPLHADLPPCDEEMERGLLSDDCCGRGAERRASAERLSSEYSSPDEGGPGGGGGGGGGGSHRRHSRSSTWTHRACPVHVGAAEGSSSGGGSTRKHRGASQGAAPMSVWELRDALATAPPDHHA